MDEERDLVTVVDEDGNEFELEVILYFEHEGREYAVLEDADQQEDDGALFLMEIISNDEDDTEDFVSIDDDALFEELWTIADEQLEELGYDVEEEL